MKVQFWSSENSIDISLVLKQKLTSIFHVDAFLISQIMFSFFLLEPKVIKWQAPIEKPEAHPFSNQHFPQAYRNMYSLFFNP